MVAVATTSDVQPLHGFKKPLTWDLYEQDSQMTDKSSKEERVPVNLT